MLNLVSGASSYFSDPDTPKEFLGRFITPRTWNNIEEIANSGYTWAADNDCFQRLDRAAYLLMIKRIGRVNRTNLKFVTVPDVPYQGRESLTRYLLWYPILDYAGLPKAFVGQNGTEELAIPWETFEAFFIGGDDRWKLGLAAAKLVREAKRRGKWVHMGRVNSDKRIEYALSIGCDSYDGTGYSKYSYAQIPRSEAVMRRSGFQPSFFGDL